MSKGSNQSDHLDSDPTTSMKFLAGLMGRRFDRVWPTEDDIKVLSTDPTLWEDPHRMM